MDSSLRLEPNHSSLPYCIPTTETDEHHASQYFDVDAGFFFIDTSLAASTPGAASDPRRRNNYFDQPEHTSPAPSTTSSAFSQTYRVPNTAVSESGNSVSSFNNISSPVAHSALPQYPQPWLDQSYPSAAFDSGPFYDDPYNGDPYGTLLAVAHDQPISFGEKRQTPDSFPIRLHLTHGRHMADPHALVHPPQQQQQQPLYQHQHHQNGVYPFGVVDHLQHQHQPHFNPQHYIPPSPTSPAPSYVSAHSLNRSGSKNVKESRSESPYFQSWQAYGHQPVLPSSSTAHIPDSSRDVENSEFDNETRERNRCPIPECGKAFKDLKAHMLTHLDERPQKCPVVSCEYHKRGFARRYDCSRHTLTHYKGTMVCSWCPGNGSSAEKSFNRADVFKRHLMTYHGVEGTTPNGRPRKTPPANSIMTSFFPSGGASGTCPTCGGTFRSPTELYEHLDECVVLHVQQLDEGEAASDRLPSATDDEEFAQAVFARNNIAFAPVNDVMNSYNEPVPELARGGGGGGGSRSSRSRRAGTTSGKGGVTKSAKLGRPRNKKSPRRQMDDGKPSKRHTSFNGDPRRQSTKDETVLSSACEARTMVPGGEPDCWIMDLGYYSASYV